MPRICNLQVILSKLQAPSQPIMPSSSPKSKFWCFTINNPTPEDLQHLQQWPQEIKPTTLIAALEKATTWHVQGYVEFSNSIRMTRIKKHLTRAHLERRKGTRENNLIYCLKQCDEISSVLLTNSEPIDQDLHPTIRLATWPLIYGLDGPWETILNEAKNKQESKLPRREALLKMKEILDNKGTLKDCFDQYFIHATACYKSLIYYKTLTSIPRTEKPRVLVLQGPTGTGKSKFCLDNYPNAYWKQRSNWWDGYEDQDAVIIDEFYGWLPFDLCLRLCDHYPLLVETKGGNVNFSSKTIVFTSNNLPNSWWKNVYFQSFARRVDEWHMFPVWGEHTIYLTYDEALPHFFSNNYIL